MRPRAPKSSRPSRTIPPALHAATLARLAELDPTTGRPHTSRSVAAWLKTTHKVTASHVAVLRLAAATSAQGEELMVAAFREAFRDAVAPATTQLRRATKCLADLVTKSRDPKAVAAAVNAHARALNTFAELAGVAAPLAVAVTHKAAITLLWPDAPADNTAPDDHAPVASPKAT